MKNKYKQTISFRISKHGLQMIDYTPKKKRKKKVKKK